MCVPVCTCTCVGCDGGAWAVWWDVWWGGLGQYEGYEVVLGAVGDVGYMGFVG
jgi:hypothetical protein